MVRKMAKKKPTSEMLDRLGWAKKSTQGMIEIGEPSSKNLSLSIAVLRGGGWGYHANFEQYSDELYMEGVSGCKNVEITY